MSWVKLDDQFPMHPKITAAGGDAAWLHVCALCYCATHLTDGILPKALVARISDRKNPSRLAGKLVEVGCWIDQGDNYELHDYLEFNPSREQILDERRRKSEAGSKGAAKRWGNRSDGTSHGTSHSDGHWKSDAPVPSPTTNPLNPPSKRAIKPDPGYQPTEIQHAYADEHHLDLESERERWLTWCDANGRTYKNTTAGFSTWLHRAVDLGRGNGQTAVIAPALDELDLGETRTVGVYECPMNLGCDNGWHDGDQGVVRCPCREVHDT